MEQRDSKSSQWKGKVTGTLPKTNADQIWPFFQDFFGIFKWFQSLSSSYGVTGNNGEIGSIRYCNGSSIPSQDSTSGKKPISWSKERLIAIDSEEKSLSYEIVDSNLGFNNYVSTIKIVSRKGDNGEEVTGCFIEWSFRVDPVEGLVLQDLMNKYEIGIQRMARKMAEALAASETA